MSEDEDIQTLIDQRAVLERKISAGAVDSIIAGLKTVTDVIEAIDGIKPDKEKRKTIKQSLATIKAWLEPVGKKKIKSTTDKSLTLFEAQKEKIRNEMKALNHTDADNALGKKGIGEIIDVDGLAIADSEWGDLQDSYGLVKKPGAGRASFYVAKNP